MVVLKKKILLTSKLLNLMLSERPGCFSTEDLIVTDADVLTEALAAALLLFTAPRLTANHRGPVPVSQSERAPR